MTRRPLDLRVQWLILAALLAAALYLLAPVLTPFAVAALFAYLGDPLVDRLERLRVPRSLGTAIVFVVVVLLLVAVLLLLVPFIERQIGKFLSQLPVWIDWFQTRATPWLVQHFGFAPDTLDTRQLIGVLQAHWKEAGGIAAWLLATVSKSGLAVIGWVVNVLLVPVVSFYLLRDWDALVDRVHALLPRAIEPTVSRLARDSDSMLGAFLRGQLSVMIALGVYYAVALWLVGLEVGPLIGMIAGLISFVPYLGAITGIIAALVAAVVQYQDWWHPLLVVLVFGIGQGLEGYVLVPRLVGNKIGLHPVAVIFAVLAGGELFGFLGVLLALPVASVIGVLLSYVYERYRASALYQSHATPSAVAVPPPSGSVDTGTPAGRARDEA